MVKLPYYEVDQAVRLVSLGHEVWVYCDVGQSYLKLHDMLLDAVKKITDRSIELSVRSCPPQEVEGPQGYRPGVLLRPFETSDLVKLIHPFDAYDMFNYFPSDSFIWDKENKDRTGECIEFVHHKTRYYITTAVKPVTKAIA